MSTFEVLSWDDVKPVWDEHLWPGRDSEPVTSMKYLGGYDLSLKEEKPFFIGFVNDALGVGAVNSYVHTSGTEWRSRGLWVHPQLRGRGFAKTMLDYMKMHISDLGGTMIWTMPRSESLYAYESVGFIRTTDYKEHDWGTNCYAIMGLRTLAELGEEATRIRERRIKFYHDHLEQLEGAPMEEARMRTRELADIEEAEWR